MPRAKNKKHESTSTLTTVSSDQPAPPQGRSKRKLNTPLYIPECLHVTMLCMNRILGQTELTRMITSYHKDLMISHAREQLDSLARELTVSEIPMRAGRSAAKRAREESLVQEYWGHLLYFKNHLDLVDYGVDKLAQGVHCWRGGRHACQLVADHRMMDWIIDMVIAHTARLLPNFIMLLRRFVSMSVDPFEQPWVINVVEFTSDAGLGPLILSMAINPTQHGLKSWEMRYFVLDLHQALVNRSQWVSRNYFFLPQLDAARRVVQSWT